MDILGRNYRENIRKQGSSMLRRGVLTAAACAGVLIGCKHNTALYEEFHTDTQGDVPTLDFRSGPPESISCEDVFHVSENNDSIHIHSIDLDVPLHKPSQSLIIHFTTHNVPDNCEIQAYVNGERVYHGSTGFISANKGRDDAPSTYDMPGKGRKIICNDIHTGPIKKLETIPRDFATDPSSDVLLIIASRPDAEKYKMVTHGGYPHTVYEEKTYCIDPDDITIRGDTTLCDEQRVHLSLQFSEHLSIPPAIAEQLYSITRFGPDGESIDTGGFLHYVPESNGTYRMEAVSFCDALATFEKEFTIQRSEGLELDVDAPHLGSCDLDTSYAISVDVSGGRPPYTLTIPLLAETLSLPVFAEKTFFSLKGHELPQQLAIVLRDSIGCTQERSVEVKGCCDALLHNQNISDILFAPNIFSPNTDGVNDSFEVFAKQYYTIGEIAIYDRRGNRVFFDENGEGGMARDGMSGGSPVSPGVYVRIATISCPDGQQGHLGGDVMVMR